MELAIGVATISGRLTVTLNYYNGFGDGDNMRKIRDRAEKILKELTID